MRKEKRGIVYIIHGWESRLEEPWFHWLKDELEKKSFRVVLFEMPDTDHPKIEDWVDHLRENVELKDDTKTYFVGHSIGCQTIMRYLEKLHKHQRVEGCVFVAPWLDLLNLSPEEMEIAHPWTTKKIDFTRVLDHCDNFLAIFSDNDQWVSLDNADKFKDKLGARIIIKKKQGHFIPSDGVEKIPEILEFIR